MQDNKASLLSAVCFREPAREPVQRAGDVGADSLFPQGTEFAKNRACTWNITA